MKLTCLSKGGGYHFPPCYIITLCDFNILLDCPIDLSALTIFSPIPTSSYQPEDVEIPDSLLYSCEPKRRRIEKTLHADNLIHAEPCYRTVTNLNLWDVSSIDLVLISSPMGMLGLPFLTRNENFSAKIYATEASATFGRLMMLDLVSMQNEFKQYYGTNQSEYSRWMSWEKIKLLHPTVKNIAVGENGADLGSWQPLYCAENVEKCMERVQSLKYCEETCFSETLIIKPFSSGLEIGSSNWTLCSSGRSITWLSSSIFDSAHAMNFDYHSLQGNDVIIFSDLSLLHGAGKDADGNRNFPTASDVLAYRDGNDTEEFSKSVVNTGESSEEMDKLAYICAHAIDSVKAGGSVLVPIGRLGIVLQLLEQISLSLEYSNLKVPILVVSSVAKEVLDYSNVVPEWVCRQRQEKLYSVFSPHWSLRIGPVVHFLRRWSGDHNSLLVLEQGVDAELALSPFKPVAMKVLQCSFLSGIKMEKVQPLLDMLQPEHILFPDDLRQQFPSYVTSSFSCIHYSINEMLHLPRVRDYVTNMETELAFQLEPRRMEQESIAIARLRGRIFIHNGNYVLSMKEPIDSSIMHDPTHWGSPDPKLLLEALNGRGINGSISQDRSFLEISKPSKALIQFHPTQTIISTDEKALANGIFEALSTVLNKI